MRKRQSGIIAVPGYLRSLCVRIYAGACFVTGDPDLNACSPGRVPVAHAHNHPGDPHFGTICARSYRTLFCADDSPTVALWHEYAHLMAPNSGHGLKWRSAITSLGHPDEAALYVQPRRVGEHVVYPLHACNHHGDAQHFTGTEWDVTRRLKLAMQLLCPDCLRAVYTHRESIP